MVECGTLDLWVVTCLTIGEFSSEAHAFIIFIAYLKRERKERKGRKKEEKEER